jgi:3-hydroxy acid dehydrogenase/malonic semialdehyde reductase
MNRNRKRAFITGATSGIGRATAIKFAEIGWDLVITGRRSDRLQELKTTLEQSYNSKIISSCFDVRERSSILQALQELPEESKQADLLLNNAGLALGKEPIQEGIPEQWETMMDTNVMGLLHMSSLLIPYLRQRKDAMIINVSSVAGKEAYPGGNVYSASKFAVEGITKSMRLDLLPFGIRVASIAPGAAVTEFSKVRFGGNEEKAAAVYKDFQPLLPEDIAEVIVFMATRPPHVCLQDVQIMPTAQANSSTILRK